MVTITTSYIVTPNQETPNGFLWLSESDQVGRHDHTPLIYIYKGKHNYDVIRKMRDSLSKVLVHYYPLAGRLSWIEGRMKLNCNSKGVVLLEAKSTKTLVDYGDFSPNEPINELIPVVDYSQPKEELPLFLAQVTRFRDEGIAIGIAFCHPLSDGLGFVYFINAWAKVARGDTLGRDEMPFLDRTILKFTNPQGGPHFDHREFKPLSLKIGSSDHTAEQKKKTTFILLKLTSKQVEILKKNANINSQSQKQGSRPYSRFEAIGAHIWRCASKARDLDENQPSVVRFNGDIRSRLNLPLPQNYFGNALAAVVTPTVCIGEIISNPLSYAAQKIREAVDMLTNEYIRSQFNFITLQKQMDFIRTSFSRQECRDVPFYGNPNLGLTSWMSMPAYEADFGWGKPIYFGPGAVCPYDRATLILSPDGDGSIVVFMNFQDAHIEKFIRFFWEDICDKGGHELLRGKL